jgi:hypothetical protein
MNFMMWAMIEGSIVVYINGWSCSSYNEDEG